MKKLLTLIIATLLFVSCREVSNQQIGDSIVLSKEEYESLKRSTQPEYPRVLGEYSTDSEGNLPMEIHVIAIDSCEYVGEVEGSENNFIAHKGNCKFCIQRREFQHQRLVDEIIYRLTNKTNDTVH